jgi:hypothetical protein
MTSAVFAFDKCTQFVPAPGPYILVPPDQFAVAPTQGRVAALLTTDTFICAGLALVPQDHQGNAGLIHVLTQYNYYRLGEDKVIEGVRAIWDRFVKAVKPQGAYHSVHFGGVHPSQKEFPGETVYASAWVNDALYDCVQESGFVKSSTDFRYQNAPHDALIDLTDARVAVGSRHHDLSWKMDGQTRLRETVKFTLPVLAA